MTAVITETIERSVEALKSLVIVLNIRNAIENRLSYRGRFRFLFAVRNSAKITASF